MEPVFVTVSGYVTGSPTLDKPENCGAPRLHRGKLPSTKSDKVAVGDCEERVSARNAEKQPSRPRAVRSTPSSRNSPAAGLVWPLLFVYDHGTAIGPPFTIAKVVPPGVVTGARLPVASSPVHRNTLTVETEPPWVKSLTRRMSPSTCLPVKGWPPLVVTFGFWPIWLWKNQKPAVASPLLSNRSNPAYSIKCPLLGSV